MNTVPTNTVILAVALLVAAIAVVAWVFMQRTCKEKGNRNDSNSVSDRNTAAR